MAISTTPVQKQCSWGGFVVDLFPIDPKHRRIVARPLFRRKGKVRRTYYHRQVLYCDPQLRYIGRPWWKRLLSLRRY